MAKEAFNTSYSYSDKVENNKAKTLSLYIGPAFFTFALYDDNFQTPVRLVETAITANQASMEETVSMLVNNFGLNQAKIQKANIGILNTSFTLVPEAYAAEPELKRLLAFSTGAGTTTSLRHNLNDVKLCFTAEQGLLGYFERTFPNASIRHSGALAINLLFSHHSLMDKDVFLNVAAGSIEIAVKNKNGLLFYNVFNYSSDEDILYYLLFTMEQFSLDPLQVKIALAGQLPVEHPLVKSIKKYIRQVHFCVHDPSIKLKNEPASLPNHYYFTLLNQHLCEL